MNKKVNVSGDGTKNDEELKPLSFYIDDRLELVKQIFSTLKPKTIKSLSPDFLKESTVQEIQEMCLNELLGISSKRLKSVIYANKCPTDTESSDSNNEENISLEEISSDSDTEKQPKRKKAGKFGKPSKNIPDNITKNENGKEMSVLELLELQARARAIRSQLALEPIAKVELDDSEDSSKKEIASKSTEKRSNQEKNSKNRSVLSKSTLITNSKTVQSKNENPKFSKGISVQPSNHLNLANAKPIKLKRNYSKPSSESASNNLSKNNHIEKLPEKTRSIENINRISTTEKTRDISVKKEIKDRTRHKDKNIERSEARSREKMDIKKTDIKKPVEKRLARSQSPDVLAILPSPEILCVSDSSDEDKRPRIKKEKIVESDLETDSSSTESSDTSSSSEDSDSEYSNDDKTNPEKMEDLRNLIQRKKNKETDNKKIQPENEINPTEITSKVTNESPQVLPNKINGNEKGEISIPEEEETILKEHPNANMTNTSLVDESIQNIDKHPKDRSLSNVEIEKSIIDCEICKVESGRSLDNSNKRMKQDDDQHNDDAISLGDAELDYGIDHIVEERSNINANIPDTPLSPEVNQSEPEELDDNEDCDNDNENIHDKSDFIDLHGSSGEEASPEENSSWNDRWLKSSKVSKILAASKLANKVRDKVKRSKKAEKEKEQLQLQQQQQQVIAERRESKNKVLSSLEEGSIKQFEKIKELVKNPQK